MRSNLKVHFLIFIVNLLAPTLSAQESFDSTSDGSDGPLDFTWAQSLPGAERDIILDPKNSDTFDPGSGRVLDPDNDNVFHFTEIKIPSSVTIRLKAPFFNWKPVYWLVSGNGELSGRLYLSGDSGHGNRADLRFPAIPGPGGFAGGLGSNPNSFATNGLGPGAGQLISGNIRGGNASYSTVASSSVGIPGEVYGNRYLLPLIGGSGGAGEGEIDMTTTAVNYGGGAGGGAILLAVSNVLSFDGYFYSDGGSPSSDSGGGSGGAIRIIATEITGNGRVQVYGGSTAGHGRARIETILPASVTVYPNNGISTVVTRWVEGTPFLPDDPRLPQWPEIRVVSVNGIALPEITTASFSLPDATVPDENPVEVIIQTMNIPTSASLNLRVVSVESADLQISPVFVSGDDSQATWQANVSFPQGFSRGYLDGSW